jgi:hypothetical protein
MISLVVSRAKFRTMRRRSTIVFGEFGTEILALGMAPERIDWILTKAESGFDPNAAFDDIGSPHGSFELFSPVAEKWLALSDIPEISKARIRCGLVAQRGQP